MVPTLTFAVALSSIFAQAVEGISFLKHESNETSEYDACACLNWKSAYQRGVTCGETNEFYLATGKSSLPLEYLEGARKALGDEFCTRFYETIDDNYCVNINMGTDVGQWCYVDKACAEKDAEWSMAHAEKPIAWKKCWPGRDKMLRDQSPEELSKIASKGSLDLGLLHKMSYPLHGTQWKYVASFWGVGLDKLTRVPEGIPATVDQLRQFLKDRWESPMASMPQVLKEGMQHIMDSGAPFSFDTADDHHPPHVIVKGKSVYLVLGPELTCMSGCKA